MQHFHTIVQMARGIIARRYVKCASMEEAMGKLAELNEILDRLDLELLNLPDSFQEEYIAKGGGKE